MIRLTFPIVAIVLTLGLAVPLLSVVSVVLRRLLARAQREDTRLHSDVLLLLLIGPTAIPLLWLFSSALHYSETLEYMQRCLFDHPASGVCIDGIAIPAGIFLLVVGAAFLTRRQARPGRLRKADEASTRRRLESLRQHVPETRGVQLLAFHDAPAPLFAFGSVRRRVGIDAAFLHETPLELLAAGVRHELAHCRHHDVLSHAAIRTALRLNPARRILEPLLRRWLRTRELACDREAVAAGADPLDLSEVILACARSGRFDAGARCTARLTQPEQHWIELRLSLLALHEQGGCDAHCRAHSRLSLPLVRLAAVVALALPHLMSLGLFDGVHHVSESVLVHVGLL